MEQLTICFAVDFGAVYQLNTALKSLLAHNKHVKVYILNHNIPQDWFIATRRRMETVGSELIDIKIDSGKVERIKKYVKDVAFPTYFRYFIPEYIPEDYVLYLDADLVVTGSLDGLKNLSLENYYCAAVPDPMNPEPDLTDSNYLNAGVLFLNNKLLKEDNMTQKFLDISDEVFHYVGCGDQSVLNLAFAHRWIELSDTYNYLPNIEYKWDKIGLAHKARYFDSLPLIIHYAIELKPWRFDTSTRLQEYWWHYYNMDWIEALENQSNIWLQNDRPQILMFTDSYLMHHLEELLQVFPKLDFVCMSYFALPENISLLARYENFKIFPSATRIMLEDKMKQASLYLSINGTGNIAQVFELAQEHRVPIFALEQTAQNQQEMCHFIAPNNEPTSLIEAIRTFIEG